TWVPFAPTLGDREDDPHANGSSCHCASVGGRGFRPTCLFSCGVSLWQLWCLHCRLPGITSKIVRSPLGCPWLSIPQTRVPLSSRGISVVEDVRALIRLGKGAFSIDLVFFPFGRTDLARDQHILGVTDLAVCIYPEALRGRSAAAILL